MASRNVEVIDIDPNYDGSLRFVIQNPDKTVRATLDVADVVVEHDAIIDQLGENEKEGVPFQLAIVRFLQAKYGVKVSVRVAAAYYQTLRRMIDETNAFFDLWQSSYADTESSQPSLESTSASPSTDAA